MCVQVRMASMMFVLVFCSTIVTAQSIYSAKLLSRQLRLSRNSSPRLRLRQLRLWSLISATAAAPTAAVATHLRDCCFGRDGASIPRLRVVVSRFLCARLRSTPWHV